MLMQNTSLECCGMLASQPGEFGCPTKRPSSDLTTLSRALLKPSSGKMDSGSRMSSSVHQWSVMTSWARNSCVKGPPSSTVSAFRKTTVSTAAPPSSPSALAKASSSAASPSSLMASVAETASLTSERISATSSHFSSTAWATWRRASTWSVMNVCTQSKTRLGSMSVSSSCLRSRKFTCQSSVIMRSSKGCRASPTSSANSWADMAPKNCAALMRPSSWRGYTDSSWASRSIEPRATCM
mmetsp:Transcript_23333/g.59576  ORF Transcript_23333/g.59576 Transcript_23333/m.59576 type:complete len:240 (+) Transcript_23333:2965-3684(+)